MTNRISNSGFDMELENEQDAFAGEESVTVTTETMWKDGALPPVDKRTEIPKLFDKFKRDDTSRRLLQKFGYQLIGAELAVELFVADLRPYTKLRSDMDLYVSPFAKVLQVGRGCEGRYRKFRPGHIVAVKDQITVQRLNPEYEARTKADEHPQFKADRRPPRIYQRAVEEWFASGYYFGIDKLEYMTDPNFTDFNENIVSEFEGRWTFRLPVQFFLWRVKRPFG